MNSEQRRRRLSVHTGNTVEQDAPGLPRSLWSDTHKPFNLTPYLSLSLPSIYLSSNLSSCSISLHLLPSIFTFVHFYSLSLSLCLSLSLPLSLSLSPLPSAMLALCHFPRLLPTSASVSISFFLKRPPDSTRRRYPVTRSLWCHRPPRSSDAR